jgi:hypothetical protein
MQITTVELLIILDLQICISSDRKLGCNENLADYFSRRVRHRLLNRHKASSLAQGRGQRRKETDLNKPYSACNAAISPSMAVISGAYCILIA